MGIYLLVHSRNNNVVVRMGLAGLLSSKGQAGTGDLPLDELGLVTIFYESYH